MSEILGSARPDSDLATDSDKVASVVPPVSNSLNSGAAILHTAVVRLLRETGLKYRQTGTISREILLALHSIFGSVLRGW